MTEHIKLSDTSAIEDFMLACDQPVRSLERRGEPTDSEKLLRATLILEESFELLEAMGIKFSPTQEQETAHINPKGFKLELDPEVDYDFIEVSDALTDITVVTKGAGLQLGIPIDHLLLNEVMPSNMTKLDENGRAIKRADGKVIKPATFRSPNIAASLGLTEN